MSGEVEILGFYSLAENTGNYIHARLVPSQIDCLAVTQVMDWCWRQVPVDLVLTWPPADPPPPPGVPAGCAVGMATVAEVGRTQRPDGLADVTLVVHVPVTVTVGASTLAAAADLLLTLALHAPPGTRVAAAVPTATCSAGAGAGAVVVHLDACLLVQVDAAVRLLVPTLGFPAPMSCPLPAPVGAGA